MIKEHIPFDLASNSYHGGRVLIKVELPSAKRNEPAKIISNSSLAGEQMGHKGQQYTIIAKNGVYSLHFRGASNFDPISNTQAKARCLQITRRMPDGHRRHPS